MGMGNLKYVIGIDGGGTKTLGYIGDECGNIICKHILGASNYLSVGEVNTKQVLTNLLKSLCQDAGITLEEVKIISLGMAGLAREKDKIVIENILNSIGYQNQVIMNSDAYTSLIGALGNKTGVVTICGTGSICMGINGAGAITRAGGWGHVISDEGSGYYIGMSCLKAIMRSYDDLEKYTLLRDKVLEFLELKAETDIINYLYSETTKKKDIASIAPIVFRIAEQGDEVANKIVNEAVDRLFEITMKVIEKVNNKALETTVAFDGGILKNVMLIRDRFTKKLLTSNSNHKIAIVDPLYNGGIGAYIIGLLKLNKEFDVSNINYME
jgi:N-acetylglucosamine kinase-like BadF-type ATPase